MLAATEDQPDAVAILRTSRAYLGSSPYRAIWFRVVRQAVMDRLQRWDDEIVTECGSSRIGGQTSGPWQNPYDELSSATKFLFHDNAFPTVCEAAGLCADAVRDRLRRAEKVTQGRYGRNDIRLKAAVAYVMGSLTMAELTELFRRNKCQKSLTK